MLWVGLPVQRFYPGDSQADAVFSPPPPLDLRGEREHGRRRLRLTHARKYFLLHSSLFPPLAGALPFPPLLKIMSGARAAFVRSPVRSFVRICGCCNELKRNKESFREGRRRGRETNDAAPSVQGTRDVESTSDQFDPALSDSGWC